MIEEVEDLNELMSFFEDQALQEEITKISRLLFKKGIKIREHKLTELEAS